MSNATPPQSQEEQQAIALAALRAPVPRLYSNGFMTAQTASDIALILLQNGSPSAILNLSYISAKSLILELQRAVESFETTVGQRLMTIEEISKLMEAEKAKAKGEPSAG
jgi:hypothetical protein